MNRWKDWYDQGKRDYQRALKDIEAGFYEWACFAFHQSAEKIVKGLGLFRGAVLWGHSITDLLRLMSQDIESPPEVLESARILDRFYIPTRHPNSFPSGKPADFFTQQTAKEAQDAADQVIRFCESHLFGQRPDPQQTFRN
ncbi:MAG: HEPN domain-containing protein [Armatimonadetes bacterium]|nr:HEPN domain-containing protein [Armatimonadota bacterium]MDW8122009.1 HEPN domain-containing protein [Armatimonadota bacterium]